MTTTRRTAPGHAGRDDFRSIPSVASLLESLNTPEVDRDIMTGVIRRELEEARREIAQGEAYDRAAIVRRCSAALDRLLATRNAPVINATGVMLHTNLGRSPVSRETATAMATAAASYLALELDPETNRRGGRMDEIATLLRALTGAESALVVNNNAAAVLVTLAGLCAGREVVVSRGEALEIGGGFRIPEVIDQSGCRLVEVGTTNRTYAADFDSAIGDPTGAVLKIHASNFRVEGFVASVTTQELAELARVRQVPLIEDLGSGTLVETTRFGLRHEPAVAETLEAGADLVLFSGDKLLGGPQAGLIVGRAELVRRIERHPLARAVRADKVTLAGIAATLRHYLAGNAESQIPIWRMIAAQAEGIASRAAKIAEAFGLSMVETMSSVGGGSLPGETLPSHAIAVAANNPGELARTLRTGNPRVFPIIREGLVLLDLRAILPEQDDALSRALAAAVGSSPRI